ncbi:MAG: metal-dependent hydrolase [Magnetococcales bacterium]|nr:metal-dependent hydrolase [Magnetococcales bacterium]
MAGFKAHFSAAAVSGGLMATTLLSAQIIEADTAIFCFIAAILGGLLPDIDSDTSTILTVSFTVFAVIFSFLVMFSQAASLSIMELLILWMAAFVFFKLAVFELFTRLTVHRGIFHSIPAAFGCFYFTPLFLGRLFHIPNQNLWLIAAFLLAGFLIHLLLDELASLNLFGLGGTRKSLGSAFKFYSDDLAATTGLYLTTALLYHLSPEINGSFDPLLTWETWETIANRFFPVGGWFSVKFSLWKWWMF